VVHPVKVGGEVGTMSLSEWWIDAAIGIDAGGNLYATWDTQAQGSDTGWVAFSTDHGKHWSPAIQATPDQLNVPHIMAVTGGPSGTAYVGWLSDSDPRGYAVYLRPFSVTKGWLSAPSRSRRLRRSVGVAWRHVRAFELLRRRPLGELGERGAGERQEVGIFATRVIVQLR